MTRTGFDRNNLLFGLAGLVVGFVLAYFLYEAVGENQPPRLAAAGAVSTQGATAGTTQPGTAQAGRTQSGAPEAGPGGLPQDGGFGSGPVNAPVMQQQLDALRRGMEDNPDDADGWLDVANMAFDLRRWDVAVESYERFLELQPDNPDIMSDLAVSLHGAGRSDEALNTFHAAQALEPAHWQSRFNEVVVLLDLARLDDASKRMEELRRLRPGDETVLRLGAEIERRRGQ